MSKPSEEQIAAVVVRWLEDLGYDVYQEVELVNGGIRADIVAKRGPELTIIETKATASLALLYQCLERRRFAHRVYAGVHVIRESAAFREVCEMAGVGLLSVRLQDPYATVRDGSDWGRERVDEVVASRRWNTRPLKLASRLRPEHKTHAKAGAQTGGHWSRWRDTCEQLARRVRVEPGITLKAAVKDVTHHYSSARVFVSTMASHVREGRVAGVKLENGALWPVEVRAP